MRVVKSPVMDNSRWEGFQPRADDVFVCTPSKCGTTWMQTIVASLIFPDGLPGPLMTISPWIEATFMMPADVMHRMLAAQTHRRAVKSHCPADAIPWFEQGKYITVVRDGRDAFMSWCNHSQRMRLPPSAHQQAEQQAQDGPAPMKRFDGDYRDYFKYWLYDNNYFDVVSSFWAIRDRPNLLFAHYADMKADLEGEMRRVAKFLNINIPESKWPAVVKRCTFESMQNNETPLADFDKMFEGGLKGFVFKGTNGRWKDVLNDEDIAMYRARVAELLPAEAARFAEFGRKAVGIS